MLVDLVCWSLHGIRESVLRQIDNVIPSEAVNQKLVVFDSFNQVQDQSFLEYDWTPVLNQARGISGAANTALKNVETPFFISFEDDLLLSKKWWSRIPRYFKDMKVAAASGVRFASQPATLRRLQQYVYMKYRGDSMIPAWLRHRHMSAYTLGKTLDNTMWRTNIIRELGGFPEMQSNTGVDPILAYKIGGQGMKWIVDYAVQSVHLRKGGLMQELKHQRWYGYGTHETWRQIEKQTRFKAPLTTWGILLRLFLSPGSGLVAAVNMRTPQIFFVHPLIRLFFTKGFLEGA